MPTEIKFFYSKSKIRRHRLVLEDGDIDGSGDFKLLPEGIRISDYSEKREGESSGLSFTRVWVANSGASEIEPRIINPGPGVEVQNMDKGELPKPYSEVRTDLMTLRIGQECSIKDPVIRVNPNDFTRYITEIVVRKVK
jgi:hypothetical protein